MKYRSLSRRHFLEGLGASLALPLLPSIMGRAEAQTVTAPKFFVATWVPHGGFATHNLYPLDETSTLATHTLYADVMGDGPHVIRSGNLLELKRTHAQTAASRPQVLPDYDTGAARVSPLLGAYCDDELLAKMNVLRGIDFLTWGGHTRGFLGNFVNNDGGVGSGIADAPIPTIDYVISRSPKFYSDGDRAVLKAPVLDAGQTHLSSFPSGTGVARNPYAQRRMGGIHDLLFDGVSSTPGQEVDRRVSLVDRVYADYARLSRGAFGPGRRISHEDRGRLEEYMAGVKSVSDRMRAQVAPGCTPVSVSAGRDNYVREGEADWEWDASAGSGSMAHQASQRAALELRNQMLVNAFLCGTTRAAVLSMSGLMDQWNPSVFSTPSQNEVDRTDAHGMLFHNHTLEDRQRVMVEQHRFFFQYGYMDLVRRLNAVEVLPGVKMLDQSVVYWSSESGPSTHDAKSVPAVLAGSGGGFFKTGQYVDYRNRDRTVRARYGNQWLAGVPQNRLLGNIAQAMGLSPADYELSDAAYATKFASRGGKVPGYGDPFIEPGDNKVPYSPLAVSEMSDKLPLL